MDEQRVSDLAFGMSSSVNTPGDAAAMLGQLKSEAAARAVAESLEESLFGRPPRNRHERRKWAKLQRGRR